MTDLLELPAIRQRTRRFSVEEYHRLGELPVELLRGVVIDRKPKSPMHCFMVHRLREIVGLQIPSDMALRQYGPLTFTDSEPEPDLSVVCRASDDYRTAHPCTAELVIEVAVCSLEIDRLKASIYAEAGVREYWIVCPAEKQVEIFMEPATDGYAGHWVVTEPALLESTALPGVKLDLASLDI